jgi:hypothetical protein
MFVERPPVAIVRKSYVSIGARLGGHTVATLAERLACLISDMNIHTLHSLQFLRTTWPNIIYAVHASRFAI